MALNINTPIEVDGVAYDKYLLNLAVSPDIRDGYTALPLSMVLTPFTDSDGTIRVLNDPEYKKVLTLADAKVAEVSIQQAAGIIEHAIQQFINAKNW